MGTAGVSGVVLAAVVVLVAALRWARWSRIKSRPQRMAEARRAQAERNVVAARARAAAFKAARKPPQDAVTDEQLLERARGIVIERQDASPGMLTREMHIGLLTAIRLLGELEKAGVVGPMNGTEPPEVLVSR